MAATDRRRVWRGQVEKEAGLRGEVNAARASLEDSKASSGAAKAQSSVMKCLMDAKKAKKITGIHGRLGDLATIDAKYDVAITTACGALNNIVVENTQVRLSLSLSLSIYMYVYACMYVYIYIYISFALSHTHTLSHSLSLSVLRPAGRVGLGHRLSYSHSLTHTLSFAPPRSHPLSLAQVAQRCCDLLRSSGAGVATFLMLDKQRHLADKMHKPAEAFPAPRLFDLVQVTSPPLLPYWYQMNSIVHSSIFFFITLKPRVE